jgi:CBS-domain-containing membrane protein
MTAAVHNGTTTTLTLSARTAADLMMPNPVSVRDSARVADAVALLTRKGIHAAPVIDESGRPIGVLSHTDILVHERARWETGGSGPDESRVRDLMTPAVFSVSVDAPAHRVVGDMTALNVHQLFVVDQANVLVGVVAALDVLRHLSK